MEYLILFGVFTLLMLINQGLTTSLAAPRLL